MKLSGIRSDPQIIDRIGEHLAKSGLASSVLVGPIVSGTTIRGVDEAKYVELIEPPRRTGPPS